MNKIILDSREMAHPLPFQLAVQHLKEMKEDDYLYMINNKKPTPLLAMLDEKGFAHFEHQESKEIWHILISKSSTLNLKSLLHV